MKIAICGKMCSGKSTLANHIMRTFPGYQKYSFAKRVKELCVELFDMKGKDRELLIKFANSMREIDPNVWIKQVLKETKDKENCIIDDVRYQNEVNALIHDGWKIIQSLPFREKIEFLNTGLSSFIYEEIVYNVYREFVLCECDESLEGEDILLVPYLLKEEDGSMSVVNY